MIKNVFKMIGILFGGYLSLLPEEIPEEDRKAAIKQWRAVSRSYVWKVLLTWFPMGMLTAMTARPTINHLGESEEVMSDKYQRQGSSVYWQYEASPHDFLDDYNIYEDSVTGEPSGKWSATVNNTWWGKMLYGGYEAERGWIGKYLYITRNPFNKGKRTNPKYTCFVNDCMVEYWGKYKLSDKNKDPEEKGWYFVKATHKVTGKVYYGYREVNMAGTDKVEQIRVGFKISPHHKDELQDIDDLDKAYTARWQPRSDIN